MTDVVTIPMNGFTGMTDNEMAMINGGTDMFGQVISGVAGAAAGAILGSYVAMGAAATGHDARDVNRCIITGATIGACCVFLP